MGQKKEPRVRPQYHYFYGSTEDQLPNSPQISESTDVLIGESLVPTDNEEETPKNSARDLRQLVVTNGSNNNKAALGVYELGEGEPLLMTNGSSRIPASKEEKDWFSSCIESVLNVRGVYPVGHLTRVFVFVTMMLLMCTLIMVLKPRRPISTTGAINGGVTPSLSIPFEVVDRAEYGDPASKIVSAELFEPSLLFNAGKKIKAKGTSLRSNTNVDPVLKVPFPTGAFWTNLVMEPQSDGLSYPIVAYPYAYKWSNSMLQASYPVIRRKVDKRSVRDQFQPDVTFHTKEAISRRHITRFDPLSVTLRYYTSDDGFWESYIVHGSPYITIMYNEATPVLKALSTFKNVMCPFDAGGNYYDGDESTMVDGLPPSNRKLKWGVCTPSDGSGDDGISALHGVQFLIQTQENMTWILFASEMIELAFDSRIRTEIVASQKFTGVLRLALIPPTAQANTQGPTTNKTMSSPQDSRLVRLSQSTGLTRLVYHAQVYPVSGSVSWDFKSSITAPTVAQNALNVISGGNTASTAPTSPERRKIGTVHFNFETRLLNPANTDSNLQLLSLGLPHHADLLGSSVTLSAKQFDLSYWCIKGEMTPVVGSSWSYNEKLTTTSFDREAPANMDPSVASLILQNIKTDMKEFLPTEKLSIYGYGKQVARLAQLAHIAKIVTKKSNTTSTVVREITGKLHDSLAALLGGSVEDTFKYDAKFGGVVSMNGLSDVNEDFGNGRYNDHHFHYGYILYASAIMGRLNASFVEEYADAVDSLLYDIAYKGNGDSLAVDNVFFPLARYKSWYDGHSFASGLFPAANGKSQESTSEAINGYYGAYLWSLVKYSLGVGGDVTGDFKDYARLLLATEIRGAKTYWQMMPPQASSGSNSTDIPHRSNIYPASLTQNYMVGNLGMLDAVCSTYFARELFYVHLINIIPVTAITAELFGPNYVEQQYNHVLAGAEIPNSWKGYAVCNKAIAEPNTAWQEAQKLASAQLDPALSKSQVLYFISTLDGFETPIISESDTSGDDFIPGGSSSSGTTSSDAGSSSSSAGAPSDAGSTCETHSNCSPLTGQCCPTAEGTMLECCQ